MRAGIPANLLRARRREERVYVGRQRRTKEVHQAAVFPQISFLFRPRGTLPTSLAATVRKMSQSDGSLAAWRTRMLVLVTLLVSLATVGQTGAALNDPVASSRLQAYYTRPLSSLVSRFDEPTEKRAYTYVSEYKRLPVYNFGIGKRWLDNGEDKRSRRYSFGIGKRTRPYNFGLGKRNEGPAEYQLDYPPVDWLRRSREEVLNEKTFEDKRSRQPYYNFGLGKRNWHSPDGESFGTGKGPSDNGLLHRYYFGLGKRALLKEVDGGKGDGDDLDDDNDGDDDDDGSDSIQ
ncbi:hypothetical protein KM043_013948 [Ampulex compressa]|nr:hypothetical protein KM043_013948 [Ampulex compressa]